MPGATATYFPPGTSGNPAGSKYGSRHKTARLLDQLAENDAVELFRVTLADALAGDQEARKIILARIWPIRKGAPVRIDFPANLNSVGSLRTIVAAMASGQISPEEAHAAAFSVLALDKVAGSSPPVPGDSRVRIYLPPNGRADVNFASLCPDPAREAPGGPPDTAPVSQDLDDTSGPPETPPAPHTA